MHMWNISWTYASDFTISFHIRITLKKKLSRFWFNETICHLIWIIWISKWDSEIIFVQSIEALKMNIEVTLFRDYSMEDLTFGMDVEVCMKCFTDKTLWFIELKRADYEA